VRAIDIGQGDAVLLQGTDGSNVLVDTGPPAAGSTLVRTLRALRVGSLDALLVSHAHLDHVGGFPALAEAFPPKVLIYQEGIADSEGWRGVQATAAHTGVRLLPAAAGDRFRVRETTLTMLGPLADAARESENEESLVARWESGGARVLLTGDIGTASEQSLLTWGTDLNADLLKVGHHGSNGSTSLDLLAAVHPRLAVLSCGRRNRFGHPGQSALERLQLSGVPVLRTDQSGMVTIHLGPGQPVVETFLPTSPDQPPQKSTAAR
jgi:beta-lactamase superfamily II metal-dependent hydrolase